MRYRYRSDIHSWLIWLVLLGATPLIWWTDWQRYTDSVPWVAAILGLVLFSLPGMSVYHHLYQDRPKSLFSYLIVGFAVSNGLVGCAGMVARVLHLPFDMIIASLVVVGWFGWLWAFVQWHQHGAPALRFPVRFSPVDLLFLLLMAAVIGVSIRYCLSKSTWVSDDNRYGAYLTNWQHSDSLDFDDVILDVDAPVNVRFWLAHFPLTQAALADLSGLHGVQWIGIYLEPLLIALSLLAVYELARALELSSRWAVTAVLVQALALSYLLQGIQWERPGIVFFQRMSLDKSVAAFTLGPIFLCLVIDFYKKTNWKSFVLMMIVGLGMMFTHPTLMGAVILIAGAYAFLELLVRRNVRTFIWTVILSGLLVAAPFAVRIYTNRAYSPETAKEAADAEGHVDELYFVSGDRFYGADARILLADLPTLPRFRDFIETFDSVLELSIWILIIVSGIMALLQVRQQALARFILGADVLLFFTFFPYTGWLLGYFLSPYHLVRVPWTFPFGIAFVYIGYYIDRVVLVRLSLKTTFRYGLAGLGVTALMFGFVWPLRVQLRATLDWQQQYDYLAEIADVYDAHQPQPATVIGIPLGLNDHLSTVSDSAKLLTMAGAARTAKQGVSRKEGRARFGAWEQIVSLETSADERLALLDQFNVRYIFVQSGQATDWVMEVADQQPEHYKVIGQEGPFILYQIQSQSAYSHDLPPTG